MDSPVLRALFPRSTRRSRGAREESGQPLLRRHEPRFHAHPIEGAEREELVHAEGVVHHVGHVAVVLGVLRHHGTRLRVDRRHQVAVVYFFAAFQVVVVSLAELVLVDAGGSVG